MARETFVVVGAGLAGTRAIEAIRDSGGHGGAVVLVGDEPGLPYDHPPLSKAVLAGTEPEQAARLHPTEWFAERDVELRLGVRATGLDPEGHTLTLADGNRIGWDRLLLATGSSARHLEVPGAELGNVHHLRTMAESTALRDRLATGRPVVIVGAGWIGLEVASAARGHGCPVTVVEPRGAPLEGVVGAEVGRYFAALHGAHGVDFRLGDGVQRFVGDTAVTHVVTTSGERVPAETVVVGVGVTPNDGLAREGGLEIDDGIVCTQDLRTSAPDVFAAGDVARWFHPTLGHHLRVEHWANAHDGGYAAGRSMLGEPVSYDAMPYFFSDQYDVGLEFVGHIPPGTTTEVVVRGDPADNAFRAFWLAGDRVIAGMHVNEWDSIDQIRDIVQAGGPLDT